MHTHVYLTSTSLQMWQLHSSFEVSCSTEEFFSGVDVWVRRPNVLNRKLVGVVCVHEAPLSVPDWTHLVSEGHGGPVSVSQLSETAPEGSNRSRVLVREFLCKERGLTPSRELVVKGMTCQQVS